MTSNEEIRDRVFEIIDDEAKTTDAAESIYMDRRLALYCISQAVELLVSRRRALKRRALRAMIQPEFTTPPHGITGSFVLTKKSKERIINNARELFAGWMINAKIVLGDATKEDLLTQALAEEQSATGHVRNAQFYRALAEPLAKGQKASEYWEPKKVARLQTKIWGHTEKPTLLFSNQQRELRK